jgi:hypothetical protein
MLHLVGEKGNIPINKEFIERWTRGGGELIHPEQD